MDNELVIKPFTMYGIASLFFFVIFKAFITPELATEYLAGVVLLGAAPCTAMVFVWSSLTKGDPAYTVVQVATNDLIILVAFIPIVKFLLGVSNVTVAKPLIKFLLRILQSQWAVMLGVRILVEPSMIIGDCKTQQDKVMKCLLK